MKDPLWKIKATLTTDSGRVVDRVAKDGLTKEGARQMLSLLRRQGYETRMEEQDD